MKTTVFQFKVKQKRQGRAEGVKHFKELQKIGKELDPPMTTIQGRRPGSMLEWRVAVALMRMKIKFEYQKPIGGGSRLRGGQVLDFWIYTTPLPRPCWVQGRHWHSGRKKTEDAYKQAKIQATYKGKVGPSIIVWEEELGSVSEAIAALRRVGL